MPSYKIKMKVNKRVTDLVLTANDVDDARSQALSRHPGSDIISIEQRGPGGAVPRPETAGAAAGSGSGMKKIILLVVIIAVAVAGYFVLKSMGKI